MSPETRDLLQAFVDRFNNKVAPSEFVRQWSAAQPKVHTEIKVTDYDPNSASGEIKGNFKPIQITISDMPSQDAIAAFVSHIRPFCQNNDPLSLGNLSELTDLSIRCKNCFLTCRKMLNDWLDKFPHEDDGEISGLEVIGQYHALENKKMKRLTRRQIFDMFLYGDIAHLSKKHRAALKKLETEQDYFFVTFMECLARVRVIVGCIAEVFEAELSGRLDKYLAGLKNGEVSCGD